MEKHTSVLSYITGGATAGAGALTLNDWAIVVGIITTVATFGLNWYYKAKDDKRRDRRSTDHDSPE